MQAITSSVSEQIVRRIWTCSGTATSFTSECQEIIGECIGEVGRARCNPDRPRSHYINPSSGRRDQVRVETFVLPGREGKHHVPSLHAQVNLIIIVIFTTTRPLYDINQFSKTCNLSI